MKAGGDGHHRRASGLIIDSDAVLIREAEVDEFTDDGRLWLYRKDGAVTADMQRHVLWHNVARKLLGGRRAAPARLRQPDPVWDPIVVRSLIERIADSTGRNWVEAIGRQLHVSEFVVYGVFVDCVLGGVAPRDRNLCHNYYERSPLSPSDPAAFADQMPSDALGVMISSHSDTPHNVRMTTFRRCRQIAESISTPASLLVAPMMPALGVCPC
jgi:hypothetical protein